MPFLIAVLRFNSPSMDSKIYTAITTSHSPKQEPPKFEFVSNPPHWAMEMPKMYCDQTGRSLVMLTVIEALETEDWRLKVSRFGRVLFVVVFNVVEKLTSGSQGGLL